MELVTACIALIRLFRDPSMWLGLTSTLLLFADVKKKKKPNFLVPTHMRKGRLASPQAQAVTDPSLGKPERKGTFVIFKNSYNEQVSLSLLFCWSWRWGGNSRGKFVWKIKALSSEDDLAKLLSFCVFLLFYSRLQ